MTLRHDLTIRQGETWSFAWQKLDASGSPVTLTGYTAKASLKRDLGADADALLSTGSDASGGSISISGSTVTLSMTSTQTQALGDLNSVEDLLWGAQGSDPGAVLEMIYDLVLTAPGGTATRELEGKAFVIRGVTP